MTTNREIEEFLEAFVSIVEESGLNFWPTNKNNQFLLDSGFNNDDVELIVKTLRPEHYEDGPVEDEKPFRPEGDVWIFGREYEGFELYIKLKLTKERGIRAECMSAHEAEFEMLLPNRRQR